jgi:hypothetical protein
VSLILRAAATATVVGGSIALLAGGNTWYPWDRTRSVFFAVVAMLSACGIAVSGPVPGLYNAKSQRCIALRWVMRGLLLCSAGHQYTEYLSSLPSLPNAQFRDGVTAACVGTVLLLVFSSDWDTRDPATSERLLSRAGGTPAWRRYAAVIPTVVTLMGSVLVIYSGWASLSGVLEWVVFRTSFVKALTLSVMASAAQLAGVLCGSSRCRAVGMFLAGSVLMDAGEAALYIYTDFVDSVNTAVLARRGMWTIVAGLLLQAATTLWIGCRGSGDEYDSVRSAETMVRSSLCDRVTAGCRVTALILAGVGALLVWVGIGAISMPDDGQFTIFSDAAARASAVYVAAVGVVGIALIAVDLALSDLRLAQDLLWLARGISFACAANQLELIALLDLSPYTYKRYL